VDHEKTPLIKIDGSDLFELKMRTYTTTHIQLFNSMPQEAPLANNTQVKSKIMKIFFFLSINQIMKVILDIIVF